MNGSETNLSSSTWPQRIAAALSGTLHRHEDEHGNLHQYYSNPNENNNHLVSLLHDEMDTNGDGTVTLHELWSWTQRTLATGHNDEHENELLSTTYSLSTWLIKTCHVLWQSCTSWSRSNVLLWLAALWVVSIIPGRLHGWSGKVLKWPILVLTYAMITLELLVYIGIRVAIRVAEATVATPKHRQLRRAMAQAQSYAEWYQLATALDRSQNRHVWLQQPHPHEPEQPEREPPKHHNTHKHHRSNKNTATNSLAGMSSDKDPTTTRTTTDSSSSSSSHNYNWRLVQELQKELQEARHHHASLSSTHQLHTTLAVLQQCTRGPNVGGIMSSDLFSYSNTGQPKQAVSDFLHHVIETLHFVTDQTLHLQQQEQEQQQPANHGGSISDDWSLEEAPSVPHSASSSSSSSASSFSNVIDSHPFAAAASSEPQPEVGLSDEPNDAQHPHNHNNTNNNPHALVLSVLKRARASYGRTALCLSGGATMGLYHFGVLLGLAHQGLLPRIISGTSAGSVVAAIVCTRTNAELNNVLQPYLVASHMTCFDRPWMQRLRSLYEHGFMFDPAVWAEKIKWFTNGDMTFEEAYRRTGRIFCITLSSTCQKAPPVLINYLSAPHVTIASAVLASSAVPGFIPPVRLQYKDSKGVIRNYGQHDQTYYDGSIRQDIPTSGLAETLNCHFFIASQCNPHIVPFFFNPKGGVGRPSRWSSGEQEHSWRGGFLLAALEMYLKNDMKSKCVFLKDLEAAVGFTSTMMTQEFEGSTTIVPQVSIKDYYMLFSDPCPHDAKRYFQAGKVAAYEHMELIKLHFSISDALEDCIAKLEGRPTTIGGGESSQRDGIGPRTTTTTKPPSPIRRRREERCASFVSRASSSSSSSPSCDSVLEPGRRSEEARTCDTSTTSSARGGGGVLDIPSEKEPENESSVSEEAPATTSRRIVVDEDKPHKCPADKAQLEQMVTQAIQQQSRGTKNNNNNNAGAIAFRAIRREEPQRRCSQEKDDVEWASRPSPSSPLSVAVGFEQWVTEAIQVKKGRGDNTLAFETLAVDDDDDFVPITPIVPSYGKIPSS